MERFGYEKGSISKAIEEAIIKWIMDQRTIDNEVEIERTKNNEAYRKMKAELYKEYSNKYITFCKGEIAEIGTEYFSTVEKTKLTYPEAKHCLVIHISIPTRRKARLGWRMKRSIMT